RPAPGRRCLPPADFGVRDCWFLAMGLTCGDADGVGAVMAEILGDGCGNGALGRRAGAEPEVVGDELGASLLDIFGNGGVAGGVLDAEVVDADGPDQILGVEELWIGVGNGSQQPSLAAVG